MNMTNIKPFIAGNWKMYKTIPEALELVKALREESAVQEEAALVVIPPFTALSEISKAIEGSQVGLGAQNMFWENEGAFTGELSPGMLKDAGCQYIKFRISPYRLTDDVAVDVGQHVVEQYQLGPKSLGGYARFIAARGRLSLEPPVPVKHIDYQFDNLGIVIYYQNLPLAGLDGIEWDLVFLHELDKTLARNSPES